MHRNRAVIMHKTGTQIMHANMHLPTYTPRATQNVSVARLKKSLYCMLVFSIDELEILCCPKHR
jgi:hypothetical protein